ncbi:hypothetical protein B0H16DRAFT_1550825, partial [Mycena metata]
MCTFIILVILSPLLLTSSSFRRLRLLITLHFFFSHYGHSIGRTSTRRRGRRKGRDGPPWDTEEHWVGHDHRVVDALLAFGTGM